MVRFRLSRYPENRGRVEYDEISGPERMMVLSSRIVRIDGSLAIQSDRTGRTVAHINLNKPFDRCIPYEGNGCGIYRVTQGHRVLEISSEAPNAQYLALEVFGFKKWPLDGYLVPP